MPLQDVIERDDGFYLIARKLKFMDAAVRRALLHAQLTGGA